MKVRLVVVPRDGSPSCTFCLNVTSMAELHARARHKWEAVRGPQQQEQQAHSPASLSLWATSSSAPKQRLFKVDSDAAFKRLEHLFTTGLADTRADRTVRVRVELREEDADLQDVRPAAPPPAQLASGSPHHPTAMSLTNSRCATPTPPLKPRNVAASSPASLCTPLPLVPPTAPAPTPLQQQWDDAVLLSSIKKSVSLWHFGSRLQHLAA